MGDSMRGSLCDLALAGLGNIDEALVADHFFRERLAGDASGKTPPAPVILEMAGLEAADRDSPERIDQVNVIGCDKRFWDLFSGGRGTRRSGSAAAAGRRDRAQRAASPAAGGRAG